VVQDLGTWYDIPGEALGGLALRGTRFFRSAFMTPQSTSSLRQMCWRHETNWTAPKPCPRNADAKLKHESHRGHESALADAESKSKQNTFTCMCEELDGPSVCTWPEMNAEQATCNYLTCEKPIVKVIGC
jgi:hypothetical protein